MEKKAIHSDQAPAAIGPYSQAIVCNGFVFTCGQIGMNAEGVMAEGLTAQTRQALENLQAVLEAAGSSMDKVVKCLVFLRDMADFAAVNEVYAEFFKQPCPARSCVAVAGLPKDGLVEIECVAAV